MNRVKLVTICICVLYIITGTFSVPLSSDDSLVASLSDFSSNNESGKEGSVTAKLNIPQIYEMHVLSHVSNRFSRTTIKSKVKNNGIAAQEATFSVILPESAFISGFIMEVDGKNYTAYVKEKEEAKKAYDEAVASGAGAAHVALSARDSNRFSVSVNVEPETKATFYLSYEELLKRQNGHYELVINIHPGQPVKDLNVEVNIAESRKLVDLKAPPIRSGNEISSFNVELDPRADLEIINETSAIVKFSPNVERQKQFAHNLGTTEEEGLAGQFVVQYDVERDPSGGEVLVQDGYFVHFFAPTNLTPMKKHVVFILDTSSSMYGQRIKQLIEAMDKILEELHSEDLFHLVEFNTNVRVWNLSNTSASTWYPSSNEIYNWEPSPIEENLTSYVFPEAYLANEDNVNKAKETVHKLDAVSATDIYTALRVGLYLVEITRTQQINGSTHQPMIIFLTDGEPTVRETSAEAIISKVSELNYGERKTPIFALSFGDDADKDFLQKLALSNAGFSKHIYEGADAALQLQDFYQQISSPLLSDVTFKYQPSSVSLTRTDFPILFAGSEIVVAGWCGTPDVDFVDGIDAWNGFEKINFKPVVEVSISSVERLWAYLTVKQLLEQKEISDQNKEEINKKALDLALKYSFVTSVSSLVVVKPNATSAVDTEIAQRAPYLDLNSHFGGMALSISGSLAYEDYVDVPDNAAVMIPMLILPSSVYTTSSSSDVLDVFHWLQPILSEHGILSISKGDYKLGLNETILDEVDCPKTPNNSTGHCKLLHQCPQVHSLLITLDVFENHFCILNDEFAGICCPDS